MIYLLQTGYKSTDSGSYLPVAIQILFAVGLVVFLMVVTHLLGPRRKTSDKLQNFSSGIESHGDARHPMAIKYFLVAILFVLNRYILDKAAHWFQHHLLVRFEHAYARFIAGSLKGKRPLFFFFGIIALMVGSIMFYFGSNPKITD